MTESQLIGALQAAIGLGPNDAHDAIKSAIADYLRDEASEFAAIKFEEAMAFADPPPEKTDFDFTDEEF